MVIYLSGCVRSDLPPTVGVLLTPQMGNKLPDGLTWAADSGMYAAPEKFNPVTYLHWLWQRRSAADRCLFATAPDVWGDARATMKLARPFLPLIRSVGFRAALVAQDGLTPGMVDWDEIDVLFTGGSDEWRATDAHYELIHEAQARGKWLHLGRVNSLKRLQTAQAAGYDSADGTYLAFGPDVNLPKLARWVKRVQAQPPLRTGE